ncbi:metalloregulator ArsR/SmtB family transcription factor [Flagellimonas halotolerans]|uniref:Metalloregulator ArsR/SmtB family transcription factor n=1 Tax=Flagellimonas halotolerans TaxID=3112164 RepID=A0ABU6IRF4_9FLAO|nr:MULTISPECIES: metalloregulator ArsR/SmtB family transcription factor [unclassified Allomuricauda]MEC3965832.1 metalloregulator ArsR/SmtB family transcription factor [Muricauda sp. SYSU M86414]MEC4265702.1 metalloregulator ArsR/SmtB family transcription factor [Muricauda sp. SYSU M84420]
MKLRRDIFQAISDPTRRAILVLLTSQTMTAGSIAEKFDAARPTISKHIQILNECDLVEANQKGREIYYELKVEKMKEIDMWLAQFRAIWENRFNQLDNVLETLKKDNDEK